MVSGYSIYVCVCEIQWSIIEITIKNLSNDLEIHSNRFKYMLYLTE